MKRPCLLSSLRAFRRNEQGVVPVLFGLLAGLFVLFAAVAIDVGNAYRIRAALQAALDSAMLSAGADPDKSDTHMRQEVERFFNSNLAGTLAAGTVSNVNLTVFPVTQTNVMHATLTATSQTFFGKSVKIDTLTYALNSTVQRAPPTEVVLVLSEGKLTHLNYDPFVTRTILDVQKQIASDLVRYILRFPDNRVSVVPYTSLVNIDVSSKRQMPSWVSVQNTPKPPAVPNPPPNWTGCAGFRPSTGGQYPDGKYMTTIDRPSVKYPTYQMPPNDPYTSYLAAGLSSRPTCRTPLIPLYDRSRQQSILKRIDDMWVPTGNSNRWQGHDNVALGLIWGWNMLNPNEPFSARSQAEIDRIGGKKVLVLFAFYDTSSWFLSHPDGQPRQASTPDEKARAVSQVHELCQNIKNDGVIIYVVLDRNTVKWGPDGPNWGDTTFPLDQCASSESTRVNFTEIDKANPFDTGDKLTPMYAMRQVGRRLTEPRLIPCPAAFCTP